MSRIGCNGADYQSFASLNAWVARCFTVAKVATRAGAQQVLDIEYLTIETASDTSDYFEILELFQHFVSLRPMVALSCTGCVIKNETESAVAYWFAVDSPDSSVGKTHRQKQ